MDEFIKDIAKTLGRDSRIISERSAGAAALEKNYQDRIKMAEKQAKVEGERSKAIVDIVKDVLDRLDTYADALERDASSFDSVAETFSSMGYGTYAVQCQEKAEQLRDLVARNKTFKEHIKTILDAP